MRKFVKIIVTHILKRNSTLKNSHNGEICYIFGNGASLKYMNLNHFNNYPTIGLNHICLHKQFENLDLRYIVLIESFFFYPFFKNPYSGRYQFNYFFKVFYNSIINSNKNFRIFTNISNILNFFFWRRSNYLYSFNTKTMTSKKNDIAGEFSFMDGALEAGIAIAINLGFKKAILVGCDYLFKPTFAGHFYAFGPEKLIKNQNHNEYEKLFSELKNKIELEVLTINQDTKYSLKSHNYTSYTNEAPSYKENNEIVDKKFLEILRQAVEKKQYGNKI